MADIHNAEEVVPPESPHEFHEYGGRRWPVVLGYILIALAVGLGVVLLGRTVYRSAHHNTTKPQTPTQTQNINKKQPPKPSGAGNAAVTLSPTPSPNQLSNTGPGSVAVIFTASALTAGSFHYLFKRR